MRTKPIGVCIIGCLVFLTAAAYGRSQRSPFPVASPWTPAERWTSELTMHDYFIDQFLESPGFGDSRMVMPRMTILDSMRLIIGCESYVKGRSPDPGVYKLEKIALIGIAKHSSPVVFVSRFHGLPSGSPTRPLTAFEQKALAGLRIGETMVSQTDEKGNAVAIGAVQARKECLGCHETYKVGDLLGAFSYGLVPAPPEEKDEKDEKARGVGR
ncbi:MAG TPA: hypothetical protein VFY29_17110 [Terriglobia bacterium]|nr:hypothetical protein [Terriglobia bacterium]